MAFGKPKAPKEPKPPKAPKEKKPKKEKPPKPKKEKKPLKPKKGKKGQPVAEEVEGAEGEGQGGKKKFPILLLIPVVVIIAAAAIIIFVVLPRLKGEEAPDPEVSATVEPQPPELPSQIPIGDDVNIAGMLLGADVSEAKVEKSKRVTYTYTDLVDAGKAAETYVGQLSGDGFSVVDEEFVRQTDKPDYTTEEGMVLLARNVSVKQDAAAAASAAPAESVEPTESLDPEASAEPTPTPTPEPDPEPTPEPVTYVHTVRITWSPGVCVVTADEEEGKVTAPANAAAAQHSVSQRSARKCLEAMSPAELGLPGESMDQYEVLPMDGTEMVDGKPAIRLHVYNDHNVAGSNDIMGMYLMTIDGEHLYRLDLGTNEVIELDFEYNQ